MVTKKENLFLKSYKIICENCVPVHARLEENHWFEANVSCC